MGAKTSLLNNNPSCPRQAEKAVQSGTKTDASALIAIAEKAIKAISALHTSMASVTNPLKAMKKEIAKQLTNKSKLDMFLVCESCLSPQVRRCFV